MTSPVALLVHSTTRLYPLLARLGGPTIGAVIVKTRVSAMVVATTSRMLRMRRALKSTNGATSRWVVDSGTTVHRISDGEAELAGMARIPVPTAVSFTAANGTTYSAHYAKLTLPGTNISYRPPCWRLHPTSRLCVSCDCTKALGSSACRPRHRCSFSLIWGSH